MTVHIMEPRRIASLVLVILLVAAAVLIAYALTGSDPVSVGRS